MKMKDKISKYKRILLIVSLSILIITLIIVSIAFSPRKISSYIKEDMTTLQKFEIVYFEDRYEIDVKSEYEIIEEIVNVKIKPLITWNKKVTTPYEIILYFEDNYYRIKGNKIVSLEKVRYYKDEGDYLYSIVEKYIGKYD